MDLGEVGRYWHTACPYFCDSGKSTEGQVVIFGGCKHDDSVEAVQFEALQDLTILTFGMVTFRLRLLVHGLIGMA